MKTKHWFLNTFLFSVALLLIACDTTSNSQTNNQAVKNHSLIELKGRIMGTTFSVQLAQVDIEKWNQKRLVSLEQDINQLLINFDNNMSNWNPNSHINKFNQSQSTDWYPVSDNFAKVVYKAQSMSALTDGAFDITISPLIKLWGFLNGSNVDVISNTPTVEALNNVKLHIGYEKLEVKLSPPALRKKHPKLMINLAAIAKGYAVDLISALLSSKGLNNHLIEIGGEVYLKGSKLDKNNKKQPWSIAIEKPEDNLSLNNRKAIIIKELENMAVATSGDYRNYREKNGRRLSHIIDPKTNQPIHHNLASITVLAKTCMEADALATALMVMGTSKAIEFVKQNDLQAYLIERNSPESDSDDKGVVFKSTDLIKSLL